jgi:hypothetical protein
MINDFMIVGRDDEGCHPLSAKPGFVFVLSVKYIFSSRCARYAEVCSGNAPVKTGRIDNVRICGIDGVTAAFTTRSSLKIHRLVSFKDISGSISIFEHLSPETAMILHGTIDAEGCVHIEIDIKKLA